MYTIEKTHTCIFKYGDDSKDNSNFVKKNGNELTMNIDILPLHNGVSNCYFKVDKVGLETGTSLKNKNVMVCCDGIRGMSINNKNNDIIVYAHKVPSDHSLGDFIANKNAQFDISNKLITRLNNIGTKKTGTTNNMEFVFRLSCDDKPLTDIESFYIELTIFYVIPCK